MRETVVLTGGAGFIGSHIADALLGIGHRVVVIDDLSGGRREQVPAAAEFYPLDIRSAEAAQVIQDVGATTLCHHAAQMDVRRSVEDPRFDAEVNLIGLLNLLEGGRQAKLKRVIFASSGGTVYGEQSTFPADEGHRTQPVSPYGVSKLASEHYLHFYHVAYQMDVVALRYANVYGPRQNPHGEAGVVAIFINRLLAGQACTIFGDGEQTRDYVYVGDVVAANLAALQCRGSHVFNVGTAVETSVNQLIRALLQHIPGPDPEYAAARLGELPRNAISSARLAQQLGVEINTQLDEGLRRTVDWFKQV